MVNTEFYSSAKIYKIVCNVTGLIYVGSTCKLLCQRIAQHRTNYKRYLEGKFNYITSFKILENGDYNIILIEELKNCENIEQLRARERHYIESLECVNKRIEGRTPGEYRNTHKEEKKKIDKKYYELNKIKLIEKQKKYAEMNKDKIKEYQKEYTKTNKQKIICACCNKEIVKRNFKEHEKTLNHMKNKSNTNVL
jgi:hypothetical protein